MKSSSKPKAAHVEAALTLADCIVRAARGHARADGGIAFSGMLFIRDCPAASFRNEGKGGCTVFQVRDRFQFAEFDALAKAIRSENFEQAENLVGELWDAAYLRGVK